jgi:type II secretory pathway predicted ATPase ExeA
MPELLQTKSYRLLKSCLREAIDEGTNAIVYGPPSSEKSYVLKTLCDQLNADRETAIYVYCGSQCTESHLWRSIARAAKISVRSSFRWACRYQVIDAMFSRAKLPAIILDEAQHLDVGALEGVRELHDCTARKDRRGCGVILAGSHSLLREFLHPQRRSRLEQMLSRFPYRIQLEGMSRQEILSLAAKAFGNGKLAEFSEKQEATLLERCTVEDPYFIGADAKPQLRTYYSSRRLLEYIRQQKRGALSVVAGRPS